MHVANGMYGLILVEPPGGPADGRPRVLRHAGRALHDGQVSRAGAADVRHGEGLDEKPTYVVFNGAEAALDGDNALTAKVGETVRIFFGNGGPNLDANFHVIGEIFDSVYPEGG